VRTIGPIGIRVGDGDGILVDIETDEERVGWSMADLQWKCPLAWRAVPLSPEPGQPVILPEVGPSGNWEAYGLARPN